MKNYKYVGPLAHNSTILVTEGDKKVERDLLLSNGCIAMLPENHPVVEALISSGYLVEVEITKTNKK